MQLAAAVQASEQARASGLRRASGLVRRRAERRLLAMALGGWLCRHRDLERRQHLNERQRWLVLARPWRRFRQAVALSRAFGWQRHCWSEQVVAAAGELEDRVAVAESAVRIAGLVAELSVYAPPAAGSALADVHPAMKAQMLEPGDDGVKWLGTVAAVAEFGAAAACTPDPAGWPVHLVGVPATGGVDGSAAVALGRPGHVSVFSPPGQPTSAVAGWHRRVARQAEVAGAVAVVFLRQDAVGGGGGGLGVESDHQLADLPRQLRCVAAVAEALASLPIQADTAAHGTVSYRFRRGEVATIHELAWPPADGHGWLEQWGRATEGWLRLGGGAEWAELSLGLRDVSVPVLSLPAGQSQAAMALLAGRGTGDELRMAVRFGGPKLRRLQQTLSEYGPTAAGVDGAGGRAVAVATEEVEAVSSQLLRAVAADERSRVGAVMVRWQTVVQRQKHLVRGPRLQVGTPAALNTR